MSFSCRITAEKEEKLLLYICYSFLLIEAVKKVKCGAVRGKNKFLF